jgi:shikimate dehydrogenase
MTQRFAVIGNPVAHSRSPQIHASFGAQTGLAVDYKRLEAPLDAFLATARQFFADGGSGLSVTVPFKGEALAMAGSATLRAQLAGAANTLALRDGELLADNTDGIGLLRDLTENLGISLGGRRILLLGAGGASRGVIAPLLAEQPEALFIANRNGDRAAALAAHFADARVDGGGFEEIEGSWDLLINATSAGLSDSDLPLVPECFADDALAYEMVYGHETPFMTLARSLGARTVDGLGMLVEQAAEQFYLWRGVRPETAPVIAAVR